jgi:hypothetical protein
MKDNIYYGSLLLSNGLYLATSSLFLLLEIPRLPESEQIRSSSSTPL